MSSRPLTPQYPMDVFADVYYVPPILRLHPEIGGMFADNMDMLTLTRWRLTCKTNYDQAVASLRRTLLTMLEHFAPKPIVILGILTRHRAVLGGEFALAFVLRDYSMVPKHLDIYASDYEYRGVCRSIVKHRTFPGFVVNEEYINNSVLDALRTFVTCKLVIHTKSGTTIRISRSFTSSATAPLTHASCTALSNFVTEFGFGCSHPILTLNRRALLADQELPHLPFYDREAHDSLKEHGFSLAMSPMEWPEFCRGVGNIALGPLGSSSTASLANQAAYSITDNSNEAHEIGVGRIAEAAGTSMACVEDVTSIRVGEQTGSRFEDEAVVPAITSSDARARDATDACITGTVRIGKGTGRSPYDTKASSASDGKSAAPVDVRWEAESMRGAGEAVSAERYSRTPLPRSVDTNWSACAASHASTFGGEAHPEDTDEWNGSNAVVAAFDEGSEGNTVTDRELEGSSCLAKRAECDGLDITVTGSGHVVSDAVGSTYMPVVESKRLEGGVLAGVVDDALHAESSIARSYHSPSSIESTLQTSQSGGLVESTASVPFEPATLSEEGEYVHMPSPDDTSTVEIAGGATGPSSFHVQSQDVSHSDTAADLVDAIRRGDVIGTDESSLRLSATGWYVNVSDPASALDVHNTTGLLEAVGTSFPDPRATSEIGGGFEGSTLDSEESDEDGPGDGERIRKEVQECWRHRFVCPSQGRFFGDRGSMVEFFDPLRGGEEFCAQNSVVPFGPMVVWRVLSTFVCERGCDIYDDALDAEPSAIPVMIRRNPFDEETNVPDERTVDVIYRYRSLTP